MSSADDITALVQACVSELNRQLPSEERIDDTPETVLTGEGGRLDSLSIVTLLVAVEEALANRFGREVPLLDNPDLWEENGPYRTLGGLTGFIAGRLG